MASEIIEVSKRLRAYNRGFVRGAARRAELDESGREDAADEVYRRYAKAEFGSLERRELLGEYDALIGRD